MEFVEVIKQKERMCKAVELCNNCPLSHNNNGTDLSCYRLIKDFTEKAEKIIMKWAEEHPIKTNREVFEETIKEKFGDTLNLNKLYAMLDERGCELVNAECNGTCETCDQSNFWDREYKEV